VPGFDAYSLVEPFYFYQTPEKVVVIAQNGPEVRHIYLNVTHSMHAIGEIGAFSARRQRCTAVQGVVNAPSRPRR
jgi:hypothetical protein